MGSANQPQTTYKRLMAQRVTLYSLLALIALGTAWELVLAPLRPEGSWLVLKVLPLLAFVPGVLRGQVKRFQGLSLLVWIYFAEGVVRATSDPQVVSRWCAAAEVVLTLVLFVSVSVYARTYKQTSTTQPAES